MTHKTAFCHQIIVQHFRYAWDGVNNLSYALLSRDVLEKFTILHVRLERGAEWHHSINWIVYMKKYEVFLKPLKSTKIGNYTWLWVACNVQFCQLDTCVSFWSIMLDLACATAWSKKDIGNSCASLLPPESCDESSWFSIWSEYDQMLLHSWFTLIALSLCATAVNKDRASLLLNK